MLEQRQLMCMQNLQPIIIIKLSKLFKSSTPHPSHGLLGYNLRKSNDSC